MKRKEDKHTAWFLLVMAIVTYTIFAIDIEYDKDVLTWLFLGKAILWSLCSLRYFIKLDRLNVTDVN